MNEMPKMLPGMCPTCFGKNENCERCLGTGTAAFTIPDGPAYTRKCPDCGWTNGMYFPQPGMFVPTPGAPVQDTDGDHIGRGANFCMQCPPDASGRHKHGHMVWEILE